MRFALLLCFMSASLSSWGCPTSLNLIPVADMISPHTLRLEYENDGRPHLFGDDSQHLWLAEYGVTPRLEMGLGLYASEDTEWVLDSKLLLISESDTRPAVALGVQDVGKEYQPAYYLCAAKGLGRHRLHCGVIGDRHRVHLMLGHEVPISSEMSFMLDWVEGDEHYLAAGLCYTGSSNPSVSAVIGFPNNRDQPLLAYLNLSWEWSLR